MRCNATFALEKKSKYSWELEGKLLKDMQENHSPFFSFVYDCWNFANSLFLFKLNGMNVECFFWGGEGKRVHEMNMKKKVWWKIEHTTCVHVEGWQWKLILHFIELLLQICFTDFMSLPIFIKFLYVCATNWQIK